MKLFISYSRDDKLYVYELTDRLRDDSNHSVWIDKASLVGGESWWDAILNGIANCECVVVIISPRALGSIYCNAELRYAQALNKPILPLMLKTADIPAHLSAIQAENVSEMSLERAYGRCERALGQIELRRERGQYPEPKPSPARPTVPVLQSGQESEHVFEVYANAVEALEKDPTLAKKLLQQVITADPTGLGVQAAERLAEIEYELDRQKAYLAIARLAGNPGLHRDAVRAWKAFTGKYTAAYDPNGYVQTLNDELAAPLPKPMPPKPRFTLPLLEWINIPAGKVTLETGFDDQYNYSNKQLGAYVVASFAISKYPVTNAQFQAFIDSGYREDHVWQGLAKRETEPGESSWNEPTYPRETVNWYEAMAFTHWLSEKTGLAVTLPTEMQWQWAAVGDKKWVYPYGDAFDKNKANTSESDIKRTTPVDRYPQGASPFGVLDMSGNLWEWCLNEHNDILNNLNINKNRRSVRGGSWFDYSISARAAVRNRYYPDLRERYLGFRFVCSTPVQ